MTISRRGKPSLLEQLDWSHPLIQQAVTHRSVVSQHNERLEFLGDAVLSLVIAEWLFKTFPDENEGFLTRARAYLVRKNTLVEVAHDLNVSSYLQVGGSEGNDSSKGRYKDSIMSDAVEAIIGACYLLGGLQSARNFIEQAFAAPLDKIKGIGPRPDQLKDPKSLLQEYLQSKGCPLPIYTLCESEQEQQFTVSCQVKSLEIETKASAPKRQQAEQRAAQKALQRIQA